MKRPFIILFTQGIFIIFSICWLYLLALSINDSARPPNAMLLLLCCLTLLIVALYGLGKKKRWARRVSMLNYGIYFFLILDVQLTPSDVIYGIWWQLIPIIIQIILVLMILGLTYLPQALEYFNETNEKNMFVT